MLILRKRARTALTPAQRQLGQWERTRLERRLWRVLERSCVPLPDEYEFLFAPDRKFRADGAYIEARLLVEVQGGIWARDPGRHNRPSGYEQEARKYSLAAALGWRVIHVTASMIESGEAVELIRKALCAS